MEEYLISDVGFSAEYLSKVIIKGDRVVYTGNDTKYMGEKCVVERVIHGIFNVQYELVFDDASLGRTIVPEGVFRHDTSTGFKVNVDCGVEENRHGGCECGAWATSFANVHALWCPLYTTDMSKKGIV